MFAFNSKFHPAIIPSNKEILLNEHDLIVSKTDLNGIITYANETFISISSYNLNELIGKPHNIIRHPYMPKCIFKLLWTRLKEGRETFAYVKNLAKTGDYYWVLAHVTPSFDLNSQSIIGYHSNRRAPSRNALNQITELYDILNKTEAEHKGNTLKAMEASCDTLHNILEKKKVDYDEFIFSL